MCSLTFSVSFCATPVTRPRTHTTNTERKLTSSFYPQRGDKIEGGKSRKHRKLKVWAEDKGFTHTPVTSALYVCLMQPQSLGAANFKHMSFSSCNCSLSGTRTVYFVWDNLHPVWIQAWFAAVWGCQLLPLRQLDPFTPPTTSHCCTSHFFESGGSSKTLWIWQLKH